jgi:tetratricopeptide (TPR) repeat protein
MASALAKENGVLLFVYAFVLEISLLNFRPALAAQRLRLPLWHTVFVGLPALAALVWVMLNVDFSGAPAVSRPYNAIERLLTQSRVLWMYLELLLMPRLSELALFYDDLVISRSIFEPLSTLLAVSATAATLLLAVVARRRAPWLALAVFWFLAGHLIESTVILLELAHVHRNYVPYAGPILAIVVGINGLLGRSRMQLRRFLAVALVAGFGLVTAQRAYQWSDPVALALYEVHHRPESARANYEAGRLYFVAARAQKDPAFRAMAQQYLQRASELDRYSIGAPVALLILGGGPDYLEGDPALAILLQRLRQRPLAQAEVQYLRSLVECQSRVDCRRPAEEMLEIFAAMMESPGTAPGPKADMLAVIGLYYARVLGDLPACLRVMEEAVRVAPDNPIYTLNLAQAYMVARRLDAAAAMLTDAERSDRLGAYASRIAALRSDLSALARGEG